MHSTKVLIASADAPFRTEAARALSPMPLTFCEAGTDTQHRLLSEREQDVVVYDLNQEAGFTVEALGAIRSEMPWVPIIVVAGEAELRQGRKFLEMGVFYLLPKPVSWTTLLVLIGSAARKTQKERPLD